MNEMIEFCTAILNAICDFLMEPPIFYLFSLICFAVIVGIVRSLLRATPHEKMSHQRLNMI